MNAKPFLLRSLVALGFLAAVPPAEGKQDQPQNLGYRPFVVVREKTDLRRNDDEIVADFDNYEDAKAFAKKKNNESKLSDPFFYLARKRKTDDPAAPSAPDLPVRPATPEARKTRPPNQGAASPSRKPAQAYNDPRSKREFIGEWKRVGRSKSSDGTNDEFGYWQMELVIKSDGTASSHSFYIYYHNGKRAHESTNYFRWKVIGNRIQFEVTSGTDMERYQTLPGGIKGFLLDLQDDKPKGWSKR